MKKLIAILVVFAMITGVAFAQMAPGISINAWGQGAFAPLIVESAPQYNGKVLKDSNGDELGARSYVGTGALWGYEGISEGFNLSGWSEFIGFNFSTGAAISADPDDPTGWMGGNIWAKPLSNNYLTITIGDIEDDTLRGRVGAPSPINDFLPGGAGGEDTIFSRFATDQDDGNHAYYGQHGFFLSSNPIDGLFIGIMVNTWALGDHWSSVSGLTKASDAYRYAQIGVGYTIENIGFARLQWIGGWFGTYDYGKDVIKKVDGVDTVEFEFTDVAKKIQRSDYDTDNQAAIQAAFQLTAVENLNLDFGIKYFIPITEKYTFGTGSNAFTEETKFNPNGMWISLGATYQMDALNIGFFASAKFGSYASRVSDAMIKEYTATEWDGNGKPTKYDLSEDKNIDGITMDFRITPSYELDFATIGLDLAFHMVTDSKRNQFNPKKGDDGAFELATVKDGFTQLGFGLWIDKGLGSGNIVAGMAYSLAPNYDKGANGSSLFSIPVVLTYAFF